ncbi:MAG: secondary thiamine-phosphate synthase [Flammeovirgaceae bacterium TMED32]|nr:MAG: secondary thiamine-phosphate synthase [Flammeovirgaceae bacterium TMED32]
MIFQEEISLTPFPRGFHLITDLVSEVILSSGIQTGTAQVFVLHTSASLSINENSDPSVRLDFESHLNKLVPENQAYYRHNYEGSDDMPAHIKASLLGTSVHFPISSGLPRLGAWQGVYLGEHRNDGGVRKLIITVNGA